jgi:hypothetical protein
MDGTIDKQLHNYIELLDIAQKKSLIGVIKSWLQPQQQKATTLEEYNREIEESEAEIDRGEYYTQDEVVEMSKKMTSGK